jgi:hypothetical protein
MKGLNTMENLVVTPAMVLFNNNTNEELILIIGGELIITLDNGKIFEGEIVDFGTDYVDITRENGTSRFTFNLIEEIKYKD